MDDETLIENLDQAWNDAYLARRRERLRNVLAEDWVGVLPDGRTLTREELIAAAAPPDVQVEQAFSNFSLHPFDDTVITTGGVAVTAGGETVRQRFLRVYAKRGGRWWAVAVQVVPLAATG